jgi:hypothetical protein
VSQFQAISDLHTISKLPKISRSDRARARKLIGVLYQAGFLPHEIEELANTRWKRNTISKYCRELEVKNTSEKDRALGLMKEFILNNGSLEELDYYVKIKKELESEGLSIDDIVENKCDVDNYKLDLAEVASISAVLKEKGSTWNQFLDYTKLVLDVLQLGYTIQGLEILHKKTLELGGFESTIRTISFALSEAEVRNEIQSLNKDIEKIIDEAEREERNLEEIMHQAKVKQFYVDYAEQLLDKYKLDPFALQTILTTARLYGEPTLVLQSLNTFGNLRTLEESVQSKRESLKSYDDEIIKKRVQKKTMNLTLLTLTEELAL